MALDPDYKNAPFAYYRFEPSMVAAIIFIALFALTTALHTWQLCRTRVWFAITFVLGGYCGGIQSSGTLSAMHAGEKMIIAGLWV
ncbi:hypothetical protein VE04_02841 [Pseudogymnoascus sp. 24MN13]|nr:hypothetical protein VE04_02841 [Pseudogymnoascus sp. 24MN13]